MNDLYKEILVKQQSSGMDVLKKYGIIALTVLLLAGGLLINPLLLIPAVAAGVGAYFIISRFSKEFEYLYVNGDFDVDVIYNMQKRKRIGSYDAEQLIAFAPEKSSHLDEYRNQKLAVRDYTSGNEQAKVWCGIYNGEQEKEWVRFEFDDEELVGDLRRKAPRKVFMM